MVELLSLWPSVMWLVISGTVRDHKSELSQKKVTHGFSVVNQPTLLAHIIFFYSCLFFFRSGGQQCFVGRGKWLLPPPCLVCILSWIFSPDRRTGTIYSWPPSPRATLLLPRNQGKGPRLPFEVLSQRNMGLLKELLRGTFKGTFKGTPKGTWVF